MDNKNLNFIPQPLFDIKNYLPEGMTPNQNGVLPADKLQKIYCGGELYKDAARSWTAMVRAADLDGIFLNLNFAVDAYRNISAQMKRFKDRFEEIDAKKISHDSKNIQVEFGGKIWQLKKGKKITDIPGQSSHGFGLAVYIKNANEEEVQNWLEKNSESFGFVKEYDHEPFHYAYIKAQEEIPERVLEIENLPPEKNFSAEQIEEASGCKWINRPSANWICHGFFSSDPFRTGYLAVVNQGAGIGIDEKILKSAFKQCAGIICTDPKPFEKYERPILMTTNPKETVEKLTALFEETESETESDDSSMLTEIPQPLFDIKNYLPEGITPNQNGILPAKKLKKIYCGGELYKDAARSWTAMVRAADTDGIFLSLNFAVDAYRNISAQMKRFKDRFEEIDAKKISPDSKNIQVEFGGKIWQLKKGKKITDIPGQSSHGFGLAVYIKNADEEEVQNWLEKNSESFGFVKEYDHEPFHYAYIKAQEEIPSRVLEIENLPPEKNFSAEQIEKASGCVWTTLPPKGWKCYGLFSEEPFRTGYLAVVNQGAGIGIDEKLLKNTFKQCAGIICSDPKPFEKYERPILLTLNPKETVEKLTMFFEEYDDESEDSELITEIPQPLFDIKNYLPEGMTPTQNGILPADKLKKIYCGGELYKDAARSWTAMARAADLDGIFLNLNFTVDAYRNITEQIKRFKKRFEEIDATEINPDSKFLQVEFGGKIWQLRRGKNFTDIPGQSSHGFGLAVYIKNAVEDEVQNWLEKNSESFGFVREYENNLREFIYIKAREEIPPRVLEIESLPPEKNFSAEQIAEASGCVWINSPPKGWKCYGLFSEEPFRTGYLAVVNQGAGIGIDEKLLKNTFKQCAGIICSDPKPFEKYERPILLTLNPKETVEKLTTFFEEYDDESEDSELITEIPQPLFDVKNYLPEGMTPNQNGVLPADKLQKIYCGGELYKDAARSWTAMVRAAAQDGIFLNLNFAVDAYRNITEQIKRFKKRFEEIDATEINPDSKFLQVEFGGKIWQLRRGKNFTDIPGQSSHGFGLAVYIKNAVEEEVQNWLEKNSESFGFVREYENNLREFIYIKAQEEIPPRVLEIENLPPEKNFSAEQIAEASGCVWINSPPKGWKCFGLFSEEPFRTGYLAVVNQGAGIGIDQKLLKNTFKQCAGIICSDPKPFEKYERPILLTLNPRETVEKLTMFFEEYDDESEDSELITEIPQPLFDIKNYLPEGMTPTQNGILPADKLKKIYCGGELYKDAARSWTAMARAADLDGIFLNLNFTVDAYRNISAQMKRFKDRFEEIDAKKISPDSKNIQVEFGGKIWQLRRGKNFTDIPGQSSHGFGLAVYIKNAVEEEVQNWLEKNSESFGFVREYENNLREFIYIKAQEEIPPRVLEIENLPPEKNFSAEQIAEASGCVWINSPPKGWKCYGLFSEEPFRTGYLAVVNQGAGIGIDEKLLKNTFKQCAGIICSDPKPFEKYERPILLTLNPKETVEKLTTFFEEYDDESEDSELITETPQPLFDVKNYLPEGMTPNQNGVLPAGKLQKIYCGGELYKDAARSWTAMVRAAAQDGIFLNLNFAVDAYRNITEQIKRFKKRFEEIDATEVDENSKFLQVKFGGKIWQLRRGKNFTDIPGQSSHGFGLAVYIKNAVEEEVQNWLEKNSESFGFVREYENNLREFIYIKAREEIPPRVLEIENLPPEKNFSAEQIAEASGCVWMTSPPKSWKCFGLFTEEPFRTGYLAVVNQGADIGIDQKLLKNTFKQCAGIICSDPKPFEKYERPILLTLNPRETVEKLTTFFEEYDDESEDSSILREFSKPLFDIKNYLPEGVTQAHNGILHPSLQRKIHCGGWLYVDAARAWLAMVRAALQDGIFLNLNFTVDAYRTIAAQIKRFKKRFEEIDATEVDPNARNLQVEFNGRIWQLREGKSVTDIPGQSAHGFGLAVYIKNADEEEVQSWLEKNSEQFGFVREYENNLREFIYIKAREEIPPRVLEIESLPPEPEFSAEQIAEASGCIWINPPAEDWTCHGLFSSDPFLPGYLAVADQGAGIGIDKKLLKSAYKQCAGIICGDPGEFEKYERPMLVTWNVRETVEKLTKFFDENTIKFLPKENISDDPLQPELDFYKKVNPETVIFQKKKAMAERLLKIKVKDLQLASEKSWYGEYLALLAIHLENPALKFAAKKFVDKLLQWYNERIEQDERELAVLGILQFIKPQELPVPFKRHLWSREMTGDVKAVFLNYCNRLSYDDEDISTYYLARQKKWRYEKRKMRIAFILQSTGAINDKLIPVYENLKERDDTEVFLILHPNQDYDYDEKVVKRFHDTYPNDLIYDSGTLGDLRSLRPDYVFLQDAYEHWRPFPTFSVRDIVKFAKVCHVSYGLTLAQTYADKLFGEFAFFYRNLYMFFCSGESVKIEIQQQFKENVEKKYQSFEFRGYPILEQYYQMPVLKSSAKRILWTPRWGYRGVNGGSHFMEYRDNFISLTEKYGDKIKLSMRPHYMMFDWLLEKGFISEEEIENYKATLIEKNITLFDSVTTKIDENIHNTDIFLADYSSMLIVLFLTGRPIIYCEFPNAIPYPEYEEMFNAMYIARSWEDVEKYLDDLVNDRDPLFEKRQEVAKRIYETHKNATQKIVDRVVKDFKDCQIDDEEIF